MKCLIICLAFVFILLAGYTSATIINVPGDYPTIQQGINASTNGDTVIVEDGVYTENIDFIGKSITVMSENGAESTSIQIANSAVPVVSFINGETRASTIMGFSIVGDLSFWGIHVISSSPTIYNNIIMLHEAGIRVESGGALIRKNEISLCEHIDISLNKGAGIYMDYSSGAIIDSNSIHHNVAHVAPAIVVTYSNDIFVSHNIMYSNISEDYISCYGSDNSTNIEFVNNTCVNNSTNGSYLGAFFISTGANVNVINNITAFNGDYGFFNSGGNSNIYIDYNDSYGNSQGNYYGYTPGAGSISLDPLFVYPGNNDYHLLVGSPCIDAGDPNSPLDPDSTIADMGALYGAHTPPPGETIRVPADYPTIQEAINASSNSDTVLVADGIYNEHIDFIGKRILVISENGYSDAIISGVNTNIPVVRFNSGENQLSVLEGFTISNSSNAPGIEVSGASPVIYNNFVTMNSNGNGSYDYGGGIYCYNSSILIRKNIISANAAGNSGGISIWNSQNATIDSNTISDNAAANWAGGIRVRLSNNCLIKNNLIFNNSSGSGASGINLSEADNMQIINNTVDGNVSPGYGAVAIWYSQGANLVNNIVTNTIGTSGIFMGGTSSGTVTYCNSYGNSGGNYEGISPGIGCISLDPLFVGGDPFDYHLQAGSPCIDAGDPNSPLDPDGTIADMGALYSGDIVTNYGFDIADVY
ncbi:MAG: right-handed parallel beta-helix repeat-containing protein, partial [Candidatus Hodarchaeales archaeon]